MAIQARTFAFAALAAALCAFQAAAAAPAEKPAAAPARFDLSKIPDVRIFKGGETLAFRDPAVYFEDGTFHLFFTMCDPADMSTTVGYSSSRDLVRWTAPRALFPSRKTLNWSSPGNVVRFGGERILCIQTYPTPHAKRGKAEFGDESCRIFIVRTKDFRVWSEPELLMVKGPDVPREKMGRMIDPYLLQDRDGLWHCFYKHRIGRRTGVCRSVSRDLKTWKYAGFAEAGENVCVLPRDGGGWTMFHSPANGIGVKRSDDLRKWTDCGSTTLGQAGWPWARGRITAAAVLDCRKIPGIGAYLMFFHGSGPKKELEGDLWKNASIGIAWSADGVDWSWPGKK